MPAAGELIVFADVEGLVIQILNDALATPFPEVKASTKVPTSRPDEFIRVSRAGGPKETLISENATIIVEAWAQTETRAIAILNYARAVLNAQDDVIFGVTEISGLNNLPDPTTSQTRYTQTFGVRSRGAVTA